MVYTGTFQRALDGKLRVLIPKRLRSELGENGSLYLTPGTDQCLELHTEESLNDLAVRASQSNAGSRNIRSFSRLFYARAEHCDIDKQGRLRIPSTLAKLANIQSDLVFVGVGFHWELWNVSQWSSYLDQNDDAFDQVVQKTFDSPFVASIQDLTDSPASAQHNQPRVAAK